MKIELNIANQLTLVRIIAIPLYLVFLYINREWSNVTATIIFIIAGVSDFLDGFIARKYNMVTDFGKILDPIADKILVSASMIALMELDRLAGILVIIMLARDFAVGALRDLSASKGIIIPAGKWGKIKTGFQMTAIGMITFYDKWLYINWYYLGTVLIYISVVLSLYSGYIYYRNYFIQQNENSSINNIENNK